MSGVRVLVGTRKGAFVLTSDGKREQWEVSGPHFGGWEIYHVKGSPADPNRLYASQSSGWFGQLIQRSDDGGKTWEPVGNEFEYDGDPGTHQWYDGTPHPWEFTARLAPRAVPHRPRHGLRRRRGRRPVPLGRRRAELAGAARAARHGHGPVLAARRRRDVPAHDPARPGRTRTRIFIAISAAGAFRTDDAGKSWQPINRGLLSDGIPDPDAEVGHCVHRIAMHPSRPDVLFMQKHWDVMRSDDAGESWHEISGNLPTDFGFPIDVHAHEPETDLRRPDQERLGALPARGQAARLPQPDRRQRVGGRSRRPAAERLLRQRPARRDGGRLARLVRRLLRHDRRAGLRLGRRRRQLGADRPRPPGRPVRRSPDAAMIRVVLPAHLRTLAHVNGEVDPRRRRARSRSGSVLDALEARYPMLRGTIRDQATQQTAGLRAVLRLRGGPVARAAGRAAPRRGRERQRSRSWSSAPWRAVSPRSFRRTVDALRGLTVHRSYGEPVTEARFGDRFVVPLQQMLLPFGSTRFQEGDAASSEAALAGAQMGSYDVQKHLAIMQAVPIAELA